MTKVRIFLALAVFAAVFAAAGARTSVAFAQEQAAPATAQAGHETPAEREASGEERGAAHDSWKPVIAKAVNFAILVAVLVYFLRAPLLGYLTGRITKVREDLVAAATLRDTASRQLAEIDAKLAALPAEIAALRARGAEEIAAERVRIEEAAEAERHRLLEHTRREIETRLRIAKRELVEHAADLAVQAAAVRVTQTITAEDQARLVDRYASQLAGTGRAAAPRGDGAL